MRRLLLSVAVVIALAVIAPRIPGAGAGAALAQDVACAGVGEPSGGRAEPSNCVAAGAELTIRVERFAAGQLVSVFITGASGAGETGKVGGRDRAMRVGGNGVLAIQIDTASYEGVQLRAGDHTLFAKPIGAPDPPARVPFRIVGAAAPAPSTAQPIVTATRGATTPFPTATRPGGSSPTRTPEVDGTPTTGGPIASPTPGGQAGATTTATRATATTRPVAAQACGAGIIADDAPEFPVTIEDIDDVTETVTLRNLSESPVDVTGWRMCSVTGNQEHVGISGTLQGDESRSFRHTGGAIWNDATEDNGVLYNAEGELVSYWDD